MENIQGQIEAKIDDMKKEIVDLTKKLVQIPSVNPPGRYEKISEFLIEYLKEMKLDVETIEAPNEVIISKGLELPRPNVIATFSTKDPGPTLILNGHIDVVPPGPDWTVDPFKGVIKDEKLYGRGVSDMKGTIAAMIMSIKALKEAGIPLRGEVKLVLCVDEETGGFVGAQYVVEKMGVRGDYCISEGPLDSITRAWNGAWWFNLITHGKSAHGSKPWVGVNAIEKMVKIIYRLQRLQERLKSEESKISGIRYGTINLGSIQGGKEVNTICGRCVLSVSRRVIPEEDLEVAQREIKEILKESREEDPQLKVELESIFQTEPYVLPEKHPLILSAKKAAEKVLGKELEVKGSTGFIDGRFFIKHGVPTIGLGVQGEGFHGPDECIEIEQLIQATKIYAFIICDLLGT